jgi:imidazoleglycerol-phosphate dehydratase
MREITVDRKTKETDISVTMNLDGKGQCDISTSIPFLDHMLNLFGFHGLFDLRIRATGDIEIDYHHLMEDLGITMGEALLKALGDKKTIVRYGAAIIPMDECLAQVVIDLSGRPYLIYNVEPQGSIVRGLEISLFEDFFRSFTNNALVTLHITLEYGRDLHHIYEAIFKAFGRALRMAVSIDPRMKGLPTTKGRL